MVTQFETPNPILSICIPTFNRGDKVYNLVTSILQSPNEDIEVLVLDNCSTDDTYNLLTSINDRRLTYCRNDENIGGIINPLKAITLANGQFAFLCLDKDGINHNFINKLIESITATNDMVFGISALNTQEDTQDLFFTQGEEALLSLAYLSRHPTGFFYKTAIYKELPILKEWFIKKEKFSFYWDIINAEMAIRGNGLIINKTVFFTEKEEDAAQKPSFTYNASNFYFSPESRMSTFDTYLEHILTLNLINKIKIKLIGRVYRQELVLTTFGYRNMMRNPYVCAHHQIKVKKIGLFEIWKLTYVFSTHFLPKKIKIKSANKIAIAFKGFLVIVAKTALAIIKLEF